MNKQILIYSAVFAGGIGVGLIVSALIIKKKYVSRAVHEEEIESIKESLGRRTAEEYNDILNAKLQEKATNNIINAFPGKRGAFSEEAKRNYNLYSRASDNSAKEIKPTSQQVWAQKTEEARKLQDEGFTIAEIAEQMNLEEGSIEELLEDSIEQEEHEIRSDEIGQMEPYIISDVEYSEGCPAYDKIILNYYTFDGVLVEEIGQAEVEDVDATVGYNNLNLFDTQTTIWVRNERTGSDYEIATVNESYREAVMGMGSLSPREMQEIRTKQNERERRTS